MPKFEKLWRIRFQSNHFGWNNSAINFCYFASKIDREKAGCKGATFRSVNKKLYRFCSLPEKVAPLHPAKFGNVQGSVSTFADLSVTSGAAPRHVQRFRF